MSTEPDYSSSGSPNPIPESTPTSAVQPTATRGRWSWFSFVAGIAAAGVWFTLVGNSNRREFTESVRSPTIPMESAGSSSVPDVPISMAEVLQIAEDALMSMRSNVNDYSATLIKQESTDGTLSEPTEMAIKVMCKHRGGQLDDSMPMRVYLRFVAPTAVAGREVIWAEDLYDGKLVVHEAGLMGLMTFRLDPKGMIAMQGQRYPIDQIGLTVLIQKLIDRGEVDRNNPDVSVTIRRGILIDDIKCDLITVVRKKPSNDENDFSRAEICFDSERKLPLRYTAYGWAEDSLKSPLIESYTYRNIKTNLGLTDYHFDPKNTEYQFP